MGRLRDRRRGGGPAKTLSGLNRMGAMQKIMGAKGGIQYPIVGEHDGGRSETFNLEAGVPQTKDLKRFSGIYLEDVDPYSGDAIPESAATTVKVNFTTRGNNLVIWADAACSVSVWVY